MDILDKFILQAKENVESGYYEAPPKYSLIQKKVSLKETLLAREFSVIAEIKHASPAGEYSFDNINAEQAAQDFKNAGANAISVVVEPKIFKGKIQNVASAKKTGLPVLFKDFIVDEKQIAAARNSQADCILLVAKVAQRQGLDLDSLISTAHDFGLEVFLECYDTSEMKKAIETDVDILGINNRDLQTLKVDLNRTLEVIKDFKEEKRPIISESGIRCKKDAEFVKAAGARGVLVGTAIWTAKSPAEKITELTGGKK